MGLLEQEIKELRQMQKMMINKKITTEEVQARIAIYSQTEKRAKMMLSAFAMAAKHGARTFNLLTNSNVIGHNQAIDLSIEPDTEKIHCPDMDKQINRAECLDYSGDSKNIDDCKDCGHFAETRKLLIKEENNGGV